jgi:hypothetical protein
MGAAFLAWTMIAITELGNLIFNSERNFISEAFLMPFYEELFRKSMEIRFKRTILVVFVLKVSLPY